MMDGEKAEDLLNNADLRKRSYTDNLAVLNYQVADLRGDVKNLCASQGKQWDAINRNDTMIGRLEERQKAAEKSQDKWNRGLMALSVIISSVTGSLAGFWQSRR